jgi:hypothetical protein
MNRVRIAILFLAILLVQGPRAAFAGQHTWDVSEVFSNANGNIQFVELFEAGGGNFETGIANGQITSTAQTFSWSSPAVTNTGFKRYLVASQSFANLTGAPTPDAIITAGLLPFFANAGDTVSWRTYDSCTFGAIPVNGLGARDCLTDTNTASNSPTNYAGNSTPVIAALATGMVDNFQNGTLQNWGGGSSPVNQPNGGPTGAGDRYLQISSTAGPLGAFNKFQWAGNAITGGVERIDVSLNNLGANPVSIRVMVLTPGCDSGGTACTAWTSTNATNLTAASGWVTASFSLKEADLTKVLGGDTYAASLANVERVLIRHDDGTPDAPGTPIPVTSTLGIDNVLPEPGSFVGLAAGAALVAALRRRR